jgi:hypothetical protein
MAVGGTISTLNLDELGGFGVNYDEDITSLKETESPNAINIEFDETLVRKRRGYRTITPTSVGPNEQGYASINFGVDSGIQKLVAHQGNTLRTMDDVDEDLGQTVIRSSVPRAQSYFTEVNRFLIHTFDDNSTEYYWDGNTTSMQVLSPSAPGFKHATEESGFLLGGNISGNPLRVYYEDVNSMLGGSYADFFTLSGGRDDEITGFFELNGRRYATTKTGIFRISFVGGVTVFEFKKVIDTTGAVARTAKTVISDELGEIVIFLGFDLNLYIFDGSFARVISDKYRKENNDTDISLALLDRGRINNSEAVFDPIARVYRLACTRKGADTNEFMLNVDVRNLSYYPYDNMTFASMTVAEDGIGRIFLIGVDYAGRIHKLFTDVNDDNGFVIVESYEAPPMMSALDRYKKAETVNMQFTPVGNYSLIVEDRTDYDKTWNQRESLPMFRNRDRFLGQNTVLGNTAVLGSQDAILDHQYNMPVVSNIYRFRLRTGGVQGARCRDDEGTVAGTAGTTTITGTDTTWTAEMTSANGWKLWINDGIHKNEIYDFDYVSATSATVSTLAGTAPGDDFTGATYEVFKTGDAACEKRWELLKIDYVVKPMTRGKGTKTR